MFGEYAAFIIPAYLVSALAIIGMTIWIRLQYTARRRELSKLEEIGLTRRSGSNR